jgi:hypothetical protein
VTFLISEVLSFLLLFLILKILRKKAELYENNIFRLHMDFSLLIGAQIITPFVLIFLPVVLCIYAVLKRIIAKNELVVEMGILGISAYGLSNSLLTIAFIGPYKRHFLDVIVFPLLKLLRLRNNPTTTDPVIPMRNITIQTT